MQLKRVAKPMALRLANCADSLKLPRGRAAFAGGIRCVSNRRSCRAAGRACRVIGRNASQIVAGEVSLMSMSLKNQVRFPRFEAELWTKYCIQIPPQEV